MFIISPLPTPHQAREHVYDHFGVYLHQCDLCLDLFRKAAHYTRHKAIHSKREEEEQVAAGDMVGGHHLSATPTFLPWAQAKPVIDTYFTKAGPRSACKLCTHSSSSPGAMRNHLLAHHLKLLVFRCPECGEELGAEGAVRKHMSAEHGVEWEGLERVEDPEYESVETEVEVAAAEVGDVSVEELQGRKVSAAQGRVLRRSRITRVEESGVFECQLCGLTRPSMAPLSDHMMTDHFKVFIYRCSVEGCGKLLRNWSRYTTHRATHARPRTRPVARTRRQGWRAEEGREGEVVGEHHLLTEDVFVGKEEGLRVAREYFYPLEGQPR